MSETAIRQQIFTTLSAVPNIGKVYDYERWTADWNVFINLFKSSGGKILGWEISRSGLQSISISSHEDEDQHQYQIRGYMGLQDADRTEIQFNALIEAIRAAFRRDFSLTGTCELATPIQVTIIEPRTFGSVLCHYCELRLTTQEIN
jgi:hypothetical protein